MLAFRLIPRGINNYLKQTAQLHVAKILSADSSSSSSSSSSDSSDSDSDKEDNKIKKIKDVGVKADSSNNIKIDGTNDRLNQLLQKLSQPNVKKADSKESTVNKEKGLLDNFNITVKVKSKKAKAKKQKKVEEEKPFEEQLVTAAKDVAKTLGGDTHKAEMELLSKVLNLEPVDNESGVKIESPETLGLGDLLSNMKVDKETQKPTISTDYSEKRKRIANQMNRRFKEPSIGESLLHLKSKEALPRKRVALEAQLNVPHSAMGIFKNLTAEKAPNTPELSTWKAMEAREMKLATLSAPQNVFQELIQWTEQGKLWHFPINNEQGMEEEEKVHFSEHVFMERHLKDWCPKKGPLRHFMELVCTGLSKNPYMTVEEKVGHITWYRDYFEDKRALLTELECLDNVPSLVSKEQQAN